MHAHTRVQFFDLRPGSSELLGFWGESGELSGGVGGGTLADMPGLVLVA